MEKYFKSIKKNPIEEEFLRQCEQTEQSEQRANETQIDWANEKSKLENTIAQLKVEKDNYKNKYDHLKAKHIQLLQVLLKIEEKNQNLENRIASLDATFDDSKQNPVPVFDFPAELVISFFI